jgi:O-antigen ligase
VSQTNISFLNCCPQMLQICFPKLYNHMFLAELCVSNLSNVWERPNFMIMICFFFCAMFTIFNIHWWNVFFLKIEYLCIGLLICLPATRTMFINFKTLQLVKFIGCFLFTLIINLCKLQAQKQWAYPIQL